MLIPWRVYSQSKLSTVLSQDARPLMKEADLHRDAFPCGIWPSLLFGGFQARLSG